MTPNEWLLDETRRWVHRAQDDLRAAEICATELPATALSKYAWRFRYPGAPYEPDAEEAAQGRTLAELVRAVISRKLPEAALR